ncbi:MAG: hypothetical protein R3B47_19420 [Bacteroidia bacterium]
MAINANLLLPALFGRVQPLTMELGGKGSIPTIALDSGLTAFFRRTFIMTILTFGTGALLYLAPLAHRPLWLFRFLSHSTALYAALSPSSTIGVLSFLATRKAIFS